MPAAPCSVCRLPLGPPGVPGGVVECPQCGTVNGADDAPAACPHCAAAVEPHAAACGACGELLGPLGGNAPSAGDRPTDAALFSLVRVAWQGWRRRWLLLGSSVFGAVLLWVTLFLTQVLLGFAAIWIAETLLSAGEMGGGMFGVGYGLGALAALPLNAATPLGLAALHLAVARGEVPRGARFGEGPAFAPLYRARGRRRMLLCFTALAAFIGGLVAAGEQLVDVFEPLPGVWREVGYIAATAVPLAAAWLLFWPLSFLIADRPDLRYVRPLRACLTLPAGRWGGHLAAGAVGLVVMLAPALAAGLALLVDFYAWWLILDSERGLFLLSLLAAAAMTASVPAGTLLLAHAYDRADRAAADGKAPRALDPAGEL